MAEEEHQKEMADLYLPPRKRTTVNQAGQKVSKSEGGPVVFSANRYVSVLLLLLLIFYVYW